MNLNLSDEEARYLLENLLLAREYYRILAGSNKAGAANIAKYRLVEGLGRKLEEGVRAFSSGERLL